MTRRERLEMVIKGEITPELIEDCKRELEKLDRKLALMKEKETPRQEENREIGEEVLRIVEENEGIQIEEIREKLNVEVTRQRLTAICTNLIREKKLRTEDVRVKNKGKRKAYYTARWDWTDM